jgi:Zn-dependent M28 family amino/carboxypeptidase
MKVERHGLESQNVVGVRPGSDASLKNEYVVVSAHLDHVGVGEPIDGDRIYNGALDDASGVASLLDIAAGLNENKTQTKRSLLFVAVTAEEKGLLGSRYFAAHPTVAPSSLVADINMDMFLPLYPLHLLTVWGLGESDLGDLARRVSKSLDVEVQDDPQPQRNVFIRSDQYSFIREGVPSLAFKFGYEFGTPQDKIFHDWVRDRYHKPSDDLNQPVDKASAAKFNRIIVSLLERIADGAMRPQWKDDSFFKRFAK